MTEPQRRKHARQLTMNNQSDDEQAEGRSGFAIQPLERVAPHLYYLTGVEI